MLKYMHFCHPHFPKKFSVSIARSLLNWNERNRAIARIFNKLILANPIFSLSSPLLRNPMAECPQTILSNASSDPKSTELLPCNIHKHQHKSFSDLSHGLHQIQYPPKYFHAISLTMPYNEPFSVLSSVLYQVLYPPKYFHALSTNKNHSLISLMWHIRF